MVRKKENSKYMADPIFSNPRLARVYDFFDGKRTDLIHYLEIVNELDLKSVLDIGCGTGTFTSLLAKNGFAVYGIDPAEASIDIAKKKPFANNVQFILGTVQTITDLKVDLAIMTGNVAQVFTDDVDWNSNLNCIHNLLKTNKYFVFETRNPEYKAWENWTKENTYRRVHLPSLGWIEEYCQVLDVIDKLVSFRWTYVFEKQNETVTSDSTIIFRSKDNLIKSLKTNHFEVIDIREAPDRPGKEFVFITKALQK